MMGFCTENRSSLTFHCDFSVTQVTKVTKVSIWNRKLATLLFELLSCQSAFLMAYHVENCVGEKSSSDITLKL